MLDKPLVMGIINTTPDSFYSPSRCIDFSCLIHRVRQMVDQGVDVIDLGACSTRPGADLVSEVQELERLLPALKVIRKVAPDMPISIDTYRASVAEIAVRDFGASIINDVSGGADPLMFETVARLGVPYVLTHIKGSVEQMLADTHYDDLMADIADWFLIRLEQLHRLGVNDVILDPGFGFSKTLDQNYELLHKLSYLLALEHPLLVGVSRKSMIYKFLGNTPEEALNGTTVLHTLSLVAGAHIIRVHDVQSAREVVDLFIKTKNAYVCQSAD